MRKSRHEWKGAQEEGNSSSWLSLVWKPWSIITLSDTPRSPYELQGRTFDISATGGRSPRGIDLNAAASREEEEFQQGQEDEPTQPHLEPLKQDTLEYYDRQQPLEIRFSGDARKQGSLEKETGTPCFKDVTLQTWALTHSCTPSKFYRPTSVQEIQRIVKQVMLVNKSNAVEPKHLPSRIASIEDRIPYHQAIRVIGAGHSPNESAMTKHIVLSLSRLNRLVSVDTRACTVEVEAGITLKDLHETVHNHGLALQNLGSISEQSLAGALATGTHGTGVEHGIMATCVKRIEIVLGDGQVTVASERKNPELFKVALCGIGVMGILTKVTLQCCPAFDICSFESPAKLDEVVNNLQDKVYSADHYRFWWFPYTDDAWEWRGFRTKPYVNRSDTSKFLVRFGHWIDAWMKWVLFTVFGFHIFQFMLWLGTYVGFLVPIINKLWRRVLFSWKRSSVGRSDEQFNFNCLFKQHVDEWSIPLENVPIALKELKSVIEKKKYRAHFPVEVRFVDEDDIWLSPAYGRISAFIGIIMYKPYGVKVNYREYFDEFEKIMTSLGGRPHWAKNFRFTEPDFARAYPKWRSFKRLRSSVDPYDIFVNEWAERNILGLDNNAEDGKVTAFIDDANPTAKEHKAICSRLATK